MVAIKKSEHNFNYDGQGRVVLNSAKEIAAWVIKGFKEQDKRKSPDDPFYEHFIDLRNCVLSISYPMDSKTPTHEIFNFCELAGIVPGIEKIENDSEYLFEVKYDIFFDGSLLRGNFFHYVRFGGAVRMDGVTVDNTFSCFKCSFDGFVYIQKACLEQGFSFDQCRFNKGLIMCGVCAGGVNAGFNNSIFKEHLNLAASQFANQKLDNYSQSIDIKNCIVDNLNISGIRTEGVPIQIQNSEICGMKVNHIIHDALLGFDSCVLDGVVTSLAEEEGPNNHIKELLLHSCQIKAQFHVENSNFGRIAFAFGKVENTGRLRLSQCYVEDLLVSSSSISGQMDVIGNTIVKVDMEESCVPGYLVFQDNKVKEFANRQTLRLLKNEALKVNDDVSALPLYAKEMQVLLLDKTVPCWDKVSLLLNKIFSNYGQSWIRAVWVTLGLSVSLTLLMLGVGSAKYLFNSSGKFIGLEAFVTILLDSINVFSIPLFSDTIKEYDLNVGGQILYYVIKMVVAYGSYQFIVSFRKHGKK